MYPGHTLMEFTISPTKYSLCWGQLCDLKSSPLENDIWLVIFQPLDWKNQDRVYTVVYLSTWEQLTHRAQRTAPAFQVSANYCILQFSSVQFSRSVVSDSLWPHESQHARPPCPSPTPGVHSDSRPSSQRCHPAISSSVVPFSSCSQSLLASESFPRSQLFTWGGQSTGVSALASFLPKKSQVWSPLEWTAWISLQSKGLSRVFSNTTV